MDAPPIPRLVDLVHVFKGVVVEQFKKRLEKLLSDSILLWRLLKLLFKILHASFNKVFITLLRLFHELQVSATKWTFAFFERMIKVQMLKVKANSRKIQRFSGMSVWSRLRWNFNRKQYHEWKAQLIKRDYSSSGLFRSF